jgi:hypothetical protein
VGLWKTAQNIVRLLILFVVFAYISCSPVKEDSIKFQEQPFKIADYGLFDLGVADMNNDDRLDIFTANHSGLQSVMLNGGSGAFTDVYAKWKMDQDHQFPGLAVYPEEPSPDLPGININWVCPGLMVRTHQLDQGIPVSGRIEVLSPVEITDKKNFDIVVEAKERPPKATHSVIRFSGQGKGYFSFKPYIHALPIQFHFDTNLAAKDIHVGPNRISPDSQEFAIQMRDRHGLAWADLNNDGRMDLFITRGGLKGTMADVPLPFWDELLMATPNGMEDVGKTVGLAKNGCPGRQAAWIDYDRDNRLDLYVVCGRGKGSSPNMLFRQTTDGHFEDVAEQVGLDIRSNGSFLWLDADLDGDMDLFYSGSQGFFLYKNETGEFSATPLESKGRKRRSEKLTMGDYDNDGDLDVFSASGGGNVLFVNVNGNFSAFAPPSLGLPERSQTANWVDYNNDGLLDLHAVPDGLYIQRQKGKFISSSQLNIAIGKFLPVYLIGARAAWFDVDNNGTRDLLLATQMAAKKKIWADWFVKMTGDDKRLGALGYYWDIVFFNNRNTDNHWMEVQLKGPPGNPQAIGACVTLVTGDGKQFQQVGCADGAHYGQGHYRLYFGLGRHLEPLSLHVDWPDGKSTEIDHPAADRLLKVAWEDS